MEEKQSSGFRSVRENFKESYVTIALEVISWADACDETSKSGSDHENAATLATSVSQKLMRVT